MLNPRAVARSFSRAALSYDAAARLQREVARTLVAGLPDTLQGTVVDIGCGTGFVAGALAQRPGLAVIALDLAPGMLGQLREQTGITRLLQADMQALPLANASADALLSSLALQWANDLPQCLREWRRALKPGGVLHATTLVEGTLHELARGWRTVDTAVHVNRFLQADRVREALQQAGFTRIDCHAITHVLHYSSLSELAGELKAIGAHNMNPGRPAGLTGKRQWQQLSQAYEALREPAGLPATYEVLYVRAA